MIRGIDISHFNNINFDRLPSDLKFIYCKATQGDTYKDPNFNTYWQKLKTKDICRGAYHFLTVNDTAKSQAENFLSRGIDFSKPNVLPPMLDIEDQVPATLNADILKNKAAFICLAQEWISIIEAATKRKVVIYSYKNFFGEYLNNFSFPNTYLWLASYQSQAPGLPVGYNKWDFWQYSQYGKITGERVGGDLDLDYFNGTLEQLKAL